MPAARSNRTRERHLTMCLVAVALDAHPRYLLAIAANRDEFHDRAAEPAHWWREQCLAGRDLEAGGTWFGVRRDGRWALVTNVREPGKRDALAASRGGIVTDALAAPAIDAFAQRLASHGGRYNGYNLLAGDARTALWQSNRGDGIRALPQGVTGLSNAALGTPWPKVERLSSAMRAWAARGEASLEALFDALADRERVPDAKLP
ncbi:MAG: NRDE family protein, partial [Vicinamibacteria bacterium]